MLDACFESGVDRRHAESAAPTPLAMVHGTGDGGIVLYLASTASATSSSPTSLLGPEVVAVAPHARARTDPPQIRRC
jgi:hypothetical protein